MDYTLRFYAWAHHTPGTVSCTGSALPACGVARDQALTRLVEERVILRYAQAHRIRLSPLDLAHLGSEVDTVSSQRAGSRSLLNVLHVDVRFMRSVLKTELLVQRVEDAVSPENTKRGPSFHIRKYLVPFGAGESKGARAAASTLATDGSPIPAGTRQVEEWEASFRLPQAVRNDLDVAQAGQYVGPYRGKTGYLVVQLLGRAVHRYGRPARDVLEGQYFQTWMRRAVRAAAPHCSGAEPQRVCTAIEH